MIPKSESISDSLLHSITSNETSNVLSDLSEVGLDTITTSIINNELIARIPVVGTLVGLTKGVIDYRQRRYISKILSFLTETSKTNEDSRKKFEEKIAINPAECLKAGETVMDIIDKVTSTEKAIFIGRVFRAYMSEQSISTKDLIQMCEIIERTYVDDLGRIVDGLPVNEASLETVGIKKTIRHEDINKIIADAFKQYDKHKERELSSARNGMTVPSVQIPGLLGYDYTDIGIKLINILRSYK